MMSRIPCIMRRVPVESCIPLMTDFGTIFPMRLIVPEIPIIKSNRQVRAADPLICEADTPVAMA